MQNHKGSVELMRQSFYSRYVKRPLDAAFALLALIFLSPVFLVLALLVRMKLGKPVIFRQDRPGLNERIFTLCKFRTMTDEKDREGNLLPDQVRLTNFGRFLRRTSLDELPELFNILKGDMSFIGPRPLLVRYLPYYSEKERIRFSVRPGLTGLAQIRGRNYTNWDDRFALDVAYVANLTFFNDTRIFFETFISALVRKKNINTDNEHVFGDFDVYRQKQMAGRAGNERSDE